MNITDAVNNIPDVTNSSNTADNTTNILNSVTDAVNEMSDTVNEMTDAVIDHVNAGAVIEHAVIDHVSDQVNSVSVVPSVQELVESAVRNEASPDVDTPEEPPVFVCDTYTDVIGIADVSSFDYSVLIIEIAKQAHTF